jgi:hypothetical protein
MPMRTLFTNFRRASSLLGIAVAVLLLGAQAVESQHHHADGTQHAKCATCAASYAPASDACLSLPSPAPPQPTARVCFTDEPIACGHRPAPRSSRAPPLA